MEVCKESLDLLSEYCSEFLIHAADVEGLCQGIDEDLVKKLGEWTQIPTTYAGGAKDISDLDLINTLSRGRVDLTYGRHIRRHISEIRRFSGEAWSLILVISVSCQSAMICSHKRA